VPLKKAGGWIRLIRPFVWWLWQKEKAKRDRIDEEDNLEIH